MKFYGNIKKNKAITISIISICAVIVILLGCTGFAIVSGSSKKITTGIKVKGVEISGLTKEEAEKKINDSLQEKIDTDINFTTADFEYSIKLSQIELQYDVKKAVEDAFYVGREKNIFLDNFDIIKTMLKGQDIELEYTYNEKLLEDLLSDICAKIPDAVIEPNYCIEDNKLIVSKGKEGNSVDKEKLKNDILNIINNNSENTNIELSVIKTEPGNIDIEKIHEEVYKEPKNAYYTKEPFQVFPHEEGIDFDLEEAKKVLQEDKEEYEIKLIIKQPEITISQIGTEAFPDLLATFSTKYDASNRPRSNNLVLAMNKLNNVVVAPGEVFSYNKTLGQRTREAGYQDANGFAGGRTVPMLAGGICQISSTLYDAAVYANLEIVERHNHMFLAGYVGAGKDATVVYGSCDLKFKNTRKYPIMIKTSIGSGIAKVSIFGIKEDVEYEVEIASKILSYSSFSVIYEDDYSMEEGQERVVQNGMNGCKSITYKILKLNGQEVSSSVLSTDTYDAMNKIIKRGAKKSEAPAEEIVTETTPEPETVQTEAQPVIETQAEPVQETPPVEEAPITTPENNEEQNNNEQP